MKTDRARRSVSRWLAGGSTALGLALALALSPALASAGPSTASAQPHSLSAPDLTLVTLVGPGTARSSDGEAAVDTRAMLAQQDALLSSVGAGTPTYRWTTALNGFAVTLTPEQASVLEADARVALVEPNEVRPLAGLSTAKAERTLSSASRTRGGAGVVIGIVDTGIAAESPVFAATSDLGRDPRGFSGDCEPGEDWPLETCSRKIVGAQWFVDGFGRGQVRSSELLSPQDTLGHGTQVASVAAGNARVTVRLEDRDAGQFGGVAPQARIAVYKACWGAPDPSEDGCATADVVAAIDQAVSDGVGVLNLAMSGGSGVDTVQRALLGAAEADVVTIGAAGNTRKASFAAHPAPWVTTVGATVGEVARSTLRVLGGPALVGGGRLGGVTRRVLLAGKARAPGASELEARQCRAGSLDARQVADRVVVCERGGNARVDKSNAVARADGAGMVLLNVRPGGVTADFHAVPTVHLTRRDGLTLKRWLRTHDQTRVQLLREGTSDVRRTAPWSAAGDPRGPALKPDLVAAGGSILAASPDSTGHAWAPFSGSSAATAQVAGTAALLRSSHDWPASVIHSVLVSTATPVPGRSVLERGAGALSDAVRSTHLALDVAPKAWRRALETGRWAQLNTSSIMLSPGHDRTRRTVTNIGRKAEYFSVTTRGFTAHRVSVQPLAVRLAPGESATFRLSVTRTHPSLRLDDGEVIWLGARGGTTRIPVALTR